MPKKKKIRLSPRQIADLVNRELMGDSLVMAATQRGIGGTVENYDVEERMRKMEAPAEKARQPPKKKPKAGKPKAARPKKKAKPKARKKTGKRR